MKYRLEYLPIANNDIRSAAMYIAETLQAPGAAANLVREVRRKANNLRDTPYMYHEYYGEPKADTTYRVMSVKNYFVFYTVNEESKTVEIHRFLYVRMDLGALLE